MGSLTTDFRWKGLWFLVPLCSNFGICHLQESEHGTLYVRSKRNVRGTTLKFGKCKLSCWKVSAFSLQKCDVFSWPFQWKTCAGRQSGRTGGGFNLEWCCNVFAGSRRVHENLMSRRTASRVVQFCAIQITEFSFGQCTCTSVVEKKKKKIRDVFLHALENLLIFIFMSNVYIASSGPERWYVRMFSDCMCFMSPSWCRMCVKRKANGLRTIAHTIVRDAN